MNVVVENGPEDPDDAEDEELYEVWPDNWPTLEVFLRMSTQWRTGGMGGVLGLDYGALMLLFGIYKVVDTKWSFEAIQAMELAALKVLNERHAVETAKHTSHR